MDTRMHRNFASRTILAFGFIFFLLNGVRSAEGFEWQVPPTPKPEIVLPPWTAVGVTGNTLNVCGRAYEFDRLGLVRQAVSQTHSLLAGPMYFTVNGAVVAEGSASLEWAVQDPYAVLNGTSADGAVRLSTQTRVEFDGFAKTVLTVSATSGPVNLTDLTLVIPLRKARAEYLNFTTPAADWGALAWHPGRLSRFLVGDRWRSAFVPVLWLGDEKVGFSWFAESTEGWRTNGAGTEIEVVAGAETVYVKIHFIEPGSAPHRVEQAFNITYGWMATPAKPAPAGWRNWQVILETNDQRARKKGNITILWHSLWAEALGSPRPRDPALLTSLVQNARRDGYKAIIYIALTDTMADIASEGGGGGSYPIPPEVPALGDEWNHGPCSRGWGWNPSGNQHWGIRACPRSSWVDFLRFYLERDIAQYGIDGIYFDNTALIYCNKASHGCGFPALDGTRRATVPLFAQREFFKQAYRLFTDAGKTPIFVAHSSAALQVPAFSFVHAQYDGEQYTTSWRWPYTFDHLIPLDMFRGHYLGKQFGLVPILLATAAFSTQSHCREHLAYTLAHDMLLIRGWLDPAVLEQVWTIRQSFGVGGSTVQFKGYWESDLAVRCTSPQVYASYWALPDRILMVAANLGQTAVTGEVIQVDESRLGSIQNLTDTLTGQSIPSSGGRITLDIGRKDFRLLRWNRTMGSSPAGAGEGSGVAAPSAVAAGPEATGTAGSGGQADLVIHFTLSNGDVDGDNEVTTSDLASVLLAMDAMPGDPHWDPAADLDGDGEITTSDLAVVLLNMDRMGE